jgi:predicted GH43/DUF377 family glycosyl hydrolase
VILDGNEPTHIKQRSDTPLFSPDGVAWLEGVAPFTCNAPRVVFLEGVKPEGKDTFRVYFGGADAVVGSALVHVQIV